MQEPIEEPLKDRNLSIVVKYKTLKFVRLE